MKMNCMIHGPQEVGYIPEGAFSVSCPTCLSITGQESIDCPNHGIQPVKPGDSCSFCVMENLTDQPMHRVFRKENEPIISYFKPTVRRLSRR